MSKDKFIKAAKEVMENHKDTFRRLAESERKEKLSGSKRVDMGKVLLIILIVLMSIFLVEGLEHAYQSRGITCELIYIQGQSDTVHTLDYVADKMEKKFGKSGSQYIKQIQDYQLAINSAYGITKCIEIKHTFVEIVYFRIKSLLIK